jgi:uncharacterized protein YjbI with pentapeptide repeats
MTFIEFHKAYERGQKHFKDLDLEENEAFAQKDLSNIIFENCFFHSSNFSGSDLSDSQFINCNLKCIDFRQANLSNALIKNCSVECSMFKGAITTNFRFEENWCYGAVVWQNSFDEIFINEG